MTLHELRKMLPAAKSCCFFNYAATAPMLKPCADRMIEMVQEGMEPLSMHFEQWMGILESARRSVADVIHASPEEIAFTTNTSSALSLAARSIAWNPGDRILYPMNDFPSNRFIWEQLGVEAHAIDSKDFVQTILNHDLCNVRLVAISAVSYLDGKIYDISKLAAYCHSKGTLVIVDAIQAIGSISVNVSEWECDFLACGGQKWLLGPVGSGFLYINKRILPELQVPLIGWASSKDAGNFDLKELQFVDGARRFEPGLPDIAAIAGLARNLEIFSNAGWQNIFDKIAAHSLYLRQEFTAMGYCVANKDDKMPSGIVTLNLPTEKEAKDLYQECAKKNIIFTKRKNQLRISCHAVTSTEDIEKLLKVFKQPRRNVQTLHSGFKWKHALLTGASQGLGAALAKCLAQRGCQITLIARNQELLSQLADSLRKNFSVKINEVILDLSKSELVEKWLNEQAPLGIDLIINNAAWAEGGCFIDEELKEFRNALETNFFTPLTITKKYLPSMLKNQHGAILNIVTSGARCALPFFSSYASSKGALWSWSESLNRELSNSGIHVTTFVPPNMPTSTNRRLGRKALAYFTMSKQLSRPVNFEEIAEKALESLIHKKSFTASWAVRVKIALNALFPSMITKKMLRFWKTS